MSGKVSCYKNVEAHVEGKELVIRINIDTAEVRTRTGEQSGIVILADTDGAMRVPESLLCLALTLYYKR